MGVLDYMSIVVLGYSLTIPNLYNHRRFRERLMLWPNSGPLLVKHALCLGLRVWGFSRILDSSAYSVLTRPKDFCDDLLKPEY